MRGTDCKRGSQFLHTPAKTMAVIERLEELLCPSTAEVVLMWTWTIGVVDTVDHDSWKLNEGETLAFYRAQGMGHLNILSQHIVDPTMKSAHRDFLRVRRWDPNIKWKAFDCRESDRRSGTVVGFRGNLFWRFGFSPGVSVEEVVSAFLCNPTTPWKEVVGVEKVDDGLGVRRDDC